MKLTRSIHLNPFLFFIIPLVDLFLLLLLLFLVSSSLASFCIREVQRESPLL